MPMLRLTAVLALLAVAGCVAPPPAYVAGGPGVLGTQCAAGFYVCGLSVPSQVGAQCSCPGLGAPSYGVVR